MSPKDSPRQAGARQRKGSARQPRKRRSPPTAVPKRPAGKGGRRPPLRAVPDRSVVDQFSPRLREEFDRLRKEESRILKGLEDPEVKQRFLTDPAGALERMGVQVPPLMKKRLRAQPGPPDLAAARRFQLPNGQVVTARVNVRFTSGKRGSR